MGPIKPATGERRIRADLREAVRRLEATAKVNQKAAESMERSAKLMADSITNLTRVFNIRRSEMESEEKNPREKPMAKLVAKSDVQKCFRCNKFGHMARTCPLTEYGLWYCFYCQGIRNHKGDDCPNKATPKDGFVKRR